MTLITTQQSAVLNNSVVVFSKAYLPLTRITIKRAIVLLVTDQAELLDFGTTQMWEVRSPNQVLRVSEHIRLLIGNPERHWKVPPVNRREVLKRDQHRCQYCRSNRQLTLDHVIPRSKGGLHTWDNVVAACEPCNSSKSDRTPAEAGMTLLMPPKAPIHPAVAFADQFWKSQQHLTST